MGKTPVEALEAPNTLQMFMEERKIPVNLNIRKPLDPWDEETVMELPANGMQGTAQSCQC